MKKENAKNVRPPSSSRRKTANLKLLAKSQEASAQADENVRPEGRVTSSSRRSIAGRASRRKVVNPKRLRQIKMGAFSPKGRTRKMAANKGAASRTARRKPLPERTRKLG